MSVGNQVALYFAVLFGLATLLLLAWFGSRRVLGGFHLRRLERRVARVQRIVHEHRLGKFDKMERLLFQLAEVQDWTAVEAALASELESTDDELRPKVQRLFDSLGLTERYLGQVRGGARWTERAAAARILGQLGHAPAVPILVEAMRDTTEDASSVKMAAAQALGQMRAKEAVPLLLAELVTVDEWASPRIAEVLVSFGRDIVPELIAALGDEKNANVRVWAAQILGRLGDPRAVQPLLSRASDRSEQVRMSVAEALGKLGDQRAVNELMMIARRDPVSPVRAEAARALGALGDPTVVEGLVTLLGDPDYWTRLRAIEALELIRPKDTSALDLALRDDSAEVRGRAAVALQRIGVLDHRVEELGSEDRTIAERAHRTLVEMGRAGLIESILSYLEHPSFRIRSRMADVLGEVGDRHAVPALVPLLSDLEWPVRVRTLEALAKLRPKDGVKSLITSLADPEETVRATAVQAIRALGAPEDEAGIDALLSLFSAANADVRTSVIASAGHVRQPKVDELLRRGLADPNRQVRMQAVQSAGERNDEVWLSALETALGEPETDIRVKAAEGLGRLGTQVALETVVKSLSTSDRALREALSEVLASQGVSKVLDLIGEAQSLEDRLGLVWSLGKTKSPDALSVLEGLIADEEPELRAAVAGALGKIPGAPSEAPLLRLVQDRNERVRAAAVNALGTVGGGEALRALEAAILDPDVFVRDRALLALGRVGGQEAAEILIAVARPDAPPGLRARRVVGLALTGTQLGFERALAELSEPQLRTRVEALLRAEGPEVRSAFRENLRLSGRRDLGLSEGELASRYAQVIAQGQSATDRSRAVTALKALGAREHRVILLNALRTDPSAEVRALAIEALVSEVRYEEVTKGLVEALRDPSVEVQRQAARVMAEVADPRHNESLLRSFLREDPELDSAVVEALARANGGRLLHGFLDEIMGHSEPPILAGGARVLGRLQDPRGIRLLASWLVGPEIGLRAAAARALGEIATVDAREALLKAVTDPAPPVRIAVASALGALGGDATAGLEQLSSDPSVPVRLAVAEVVASGRSSHLLEIARRLATDPEPTVRSAALLALLRAADPEAPARFVELVQAQPEEVKRALCRIPSDHPALVHTRQLVCEDRRPELRAAGLRALALLADRKLEPILSGFTDPSPEVRIAAIESASRLDLPEVREAFEALLRDPDPKVRDAVRRGKLSVLK